MIQEFRASRDYFVEKVELIDFDKLVGNDQTLTLSSKANTVIIRNNGKVSFYLEDSGLPKFEWDKKINVKATSTKSKQKFMNNFTKCNIDIIVSLIEAHLNELEQD